MSSIYVSKNKHLYDRHMNEVTLISNHLKIFIHISVAQMFILIHADKTFGQASTLQIVI